MSKQSDAKEKQNYQEKPVVAKCSNCRHLLQDLHHFRSGVRIEGENPDTRLYQTGYGGPTYSDNLRCGIGGFAVKKTATCDRISIKEKI